MSTQDNEVSTVLSEWTAAERSGDAEALAACLTDDFLAVGPLGFILTKQDWLDRHAASDLIYDVFELDEVSSRRYGDTVVVTALQRKQGSMSFVAGTPGAPPIPGPPKQD